MALKPGQDNIDSRDAQWVKGDRMRIKWQACLPDGTAGGHLVTCFTSTGKVRSDIKRGSKAWKKHVDELKAKAKIECASRMREAEDEAAEARGEEVAARGPRGRVRRALPA